MILVTGGTGFVGSALIQRLTIDNLKVGIVASVRRPVENWPASIKQVQVYDLLLSTDWSIALQGVDVVVHCAARVHVMADVADDPLLAYRQTNVAGTLNLARQAAKAGVRRFIFISSIKVNGEVTNDGHPFSADDIPMPEDPYGISKMEAEHGLRELSTLTDMEVVIIRPPLIYGPGVKANFYLMMKWLKNGIPLPLAGITNNKRSLVYVENLVDLICVCLDHSKAGNQTLLVSDGNDVSTTFLLQRISKALGCSVRLFQFPPRLLGLMAKFMGRPKIADRLYGSLQVDIKKTKELLDWKPKFSLDEGLERTARQIMKSYER
jgi:nucleoside-diphosphate-sugar epimerase